MGDINAVATAIGTRLAALLGSTMKVYPGQSAGKLPRCCYDVNSTSKEGQREELECFVSVAISGTDTTALDAACAAIKGDGDMGNASGLDHYRYNSVPAGTHFCVYFTGESPAPPDDEAVRQRTLTFAITAYYM